MTFTTLHTTSSDPLAAAAAVLNARDWDTVFAGIPAAHPRNEVALQASSEDKLRDVEARLNAKRGQLAAARQERNRTRDAFAKSDKSTDSAEFRAAKAAAENFTAIESDVRALEHEQVEILKVMGSGGTTEAAGSLAAEETMAVKALTETPGALLSAILESRKADVSTLSDDLRRKPMIAAPGALTTGHYNSAVESQAVIDLLSPQSVAIRSGITVLPIDTTKTRIPRFTELPTAGWIAERGAFPKSAPGIQMVEVEPPKVGLVSPLSVEVFEDLSPLTLSMVQVQILRAVALAYDAGILFGDGTNEAPVGVAHTPGVISITSPLNGGLRPFAQSIAALIGSNAMPGALVVNPIDLGAMFNWTEFSGDTNSNVPLWKTAIQRAADGAFSLALPYFGIPVWPTPACPIGKALLYDPTDVIAVLRRPADIALDPFYGFDTGEVGLRTYLRGDVVVGQSKGAVLITFGSNATAAAATDLVTSPGHGLANGQAIVFSGLAGGAGLTNDTTYYVRDADASSFKVAATAGGAAIDITTNMTAGVVRRVD